MSDQRQPAAALALCTQIRSRIGDWYPRERTAHQQARERLVGLLELRIGQAWIKRLQAGTHPADAELLEGILAEVKQSLFAKEDTSLDVYVPSDAIPILAKAPAVKPLSTEPASQPATRSE